jgi:tetratricopeptide (TPR) repeat protein
MNEDNKTRNESNHGNRESAREENVPGGEYGASDRSRSDYENNTDIDKAYENINFRSEEEPGKTDAGGHEEYRTEKDQGHRQEKDQGYRQEENQGYRQEGNQENNPEDNQDYDQEYNQEASGKKVRIPVWVFLFLILIIALDVVCMLRFPEVLRDYKIYKTAQDRIDNSETAQVIDELYKLAERHPDSTPILVEAVELSMKNGYYDMAGYLIDTYLVGKSLSDSEYNKINSYYSRLEKYYATFDAVNQIFTDASNSLKDETAYYEEVNSKLKALLDDSGQDTAYVYYCLGMIEPDMQTSKSYMQQCYDLDPECFDVRGQLSIVYRRSGDFDKARQLAEEALRKDEADPTALRAMSTIALLEGNLESGLGYARDAYNSYPDGIYVRETLLIALTVNGEDTEAQKIREEMSAAGETLEEDTKQLLNGNITLEDYYLGE